MCRWPGERAMGFRGRWRGSGSRETDGPFYRKAPPRSSGGGAARGPGLPGARRAPPPGISGHGPSRAAGRGPFDPPKVPARGAG
ncbi:MAG: hypothetical protein Kow0092_08770 [Deferrisomatales bacterium]